MSPPGADDEPNTNAAGAAFITDEDQPVIIDNVLANDREPDCLRQYDVF